MATEAHHIYSHYDPGDRERLEAETSQHVDLDNVWEREAPRVNPLRAPAPQFVPATITYEDWAPGPSKQSQGFQKSNSSSPLGSSVSGWYKSLTGSRQSTLDVSPNRTIPMHTSSTPSTTSSSAVAAGPTQKQMLPTNKNNWFIMKAIKSEPPSTSSTPAPSLSDILDRNPPPLPSQEKFKPPVWLEIGPSNKGFGMLERAGWNEGEALGPDVARRKPVETIMPDEDILTKTNFKGKCRWDQRSDAIRTTRIETKEVEVDGADDITELRHVEVVDLTLDSDEGASDSDEDGSVGQEQDMGYSVVKEEHMGPEQGAADDIPGYERVALLTPIATVLKSDRLGIGLKAKTVGPYKASKKRVTHNTEALIAHARVAEESRRRRERFGKGKKGFDRQHKQEEARRQAMIAYLKSS